MQELHLQREINMDSKDVLVVFKGTKIRRLWHEGASIEADGGR